MKQSMAVCCKKTQNLNSKAFLSRALTNVHTKFYTIIAVNKHNTSVERIHYWQYHFPEQTINGRKSSSLRRQCGSFAHHGHLETRTEECVLNWQLIWVSQVFSFYLRNGIYLLIEKAVDTSLETNNTEITSVIVINSKCSVLLQGKSKL